MVVFGALSPHPPIIVPEVGGRQLAAAEQTVTGMKNLACDAAGQAPDTLVFITPHGNVFQDAVSALASPDLEGDLGAFGCPQVKSRHSNDLEFLQVLQGQAGKEGLPLVLLDHRFEGRLSLTLDHGILVPLYYLERAGLRSTPVVALSMALLSVPELYRLGMLLAKTASILNRRVAIIASGDMSHRLKDDGPYSYHPDGPVFDRRVKELMAAGRVEDILGMDEQLRENAGECGYRPLVIMLGAFNGCRMETEVYSYQGPFGVGYLTAAVKPGGPAENDLYAELLARSEQEMRQRREQESTMVRWARQCLETFVREGRDAFLPNPLAEEMKQRAGAFVSLKKGGRLRGCIGTLQPAQNSLALEIQANAISAGTRDNRFLPVEEEELDKLVYSVDVLGQPEPISDMNQLDPKIYGVIVRAGTRTGVLLPDLEGIDTPEEQVEIACQKAGIRRGEKFSMERFEVRRYH